MANYAPFITSANVAFAISVTDIFTAPQTINGFGPDAMFVTEAAENAELQMGADGTLAAGWVPRMYRQTITLLPGSPSVGMFETWGQTEDATKTKYAAFGTISLPSIARKYSLQNGFLTSYSPIPEAGRVLRSRTFIVTWNTITPGPI